MSQPSITAFFNSRKRAAHEDVSSVKNKVQVLGDGSRDKLVFNKSHDIAKCKHSQVVTKLNFDSPSTPKTLEAPGILENDLEATPLANTIDKTHPLDAFAKKQNAVNIAKNINDTASRKHTVNETRRELGFGDIKAKLTGSSRFAELKATAEKLSRNYQEYKSGNLKEFKTIDVEVPSSPSKKNRLQDGLLPPKKTMEVEQASHPEKLLMSPRKVIISPVKSPNKVPAYIKHASLTTATKTLPLPHHYRSVAEIFKGMEQVVSLLYNRKEKITFSKLRPSVQEMLKKNFTETHLEQIKHLVPEFYSYSIENTKIFVNSMQKQKFDLLITPILPPGVLQLSSTELLERRRLFFSRLTDVVINYHAKFLQTLDPPMVISKDKLARWHPEFDIENIAPVGRSKLPEVPNKEVYCTAGDVLEKARDIFSCNTRMERALEKLVQAKARGLTEEEKHATGLTEEPSQSVNNQSSSTPNATLINPALRNLPTSLLDKIKAKQAAKALEAMTRTSEYEKKFHIYSRLPDLARSLRNIFVTERKNVLSLNVILSKLSSTFQAKVSELDLRNDIDILIKELPSWVSYQVVRNIKYLKLNKEENLEEIKQKLQTLADKYKN